MSRHRVYVGGRCLWRNEDKTPTERFAGAELTIAGFTMVYGSWVTVLTAIAICIFAFTTALGWGLYRSRCTEFVFGRRAVRPFLALYALVSILGATVDLGCDCNLLKLHFENSQTVKLFGLLHCKTALDIADAV